MTVVHGYPFGDYYKDRIMSSLNDLVCQIYVDADIELDKLVAGLAEQLSGIVVGDEWSYIVIPRKP